MMYWLHFRRKFYAPDGGAPEGGKPDEGGEAEKTPAEIMKEMQEAHEKELEKLRAELEKEKAAHAKDVKEILLNGKKAAEDEEAQAERYEQIRKKYRG